MPNNLSDSTDRQLGLSVPDWVQPWLFDAALPLWSRQGPDHRNGGFVESLDPDGNPVGRSCRLRVQARQAYVFAEAGRLGWPGPWEDASLHALDFMLARYRRPDGLYGRSVADSSPDLYDQAFVLFALAHCYRAFGRRQDCLTRARALWRALSAALGHRIGGFEETTPPALPLRSNPHMHLLEALLAWVEIEPDAGFVQEAHQLTAFALSRFVDSGNGSIAEYFDADWAMDPNGARSEREPGHHFEWAWLLAECDRLLMTRTESVQRSLIAFATDHGIVDGSVVAETDRTGAVVDGRARLWAQSERLRTAWRLAKSVGADWRSVDDAFAGLCGHLATPRPGLWFEWRTSDGRFEQGPSPSTSLYHLTTAFSEILQPR